uniref:Uncharacterized protein n=1 Tax=Magallana gigas TaxID=29159 RepID=K1PSU4_MAGGI
MLPFAKCVANAEEKNKGKSRPKRPCPFCGQVKGRLTEHIKSKHKTEEKVKHALTLPKDLRDRAFDTMKKEGIFMANNQLLKSRDVDMTNLIRERNQGKKSLKVCSTCKGFFSTSQIYKHIRKCLGAEGSTNTPVSLSTRSLVDDSEFTTDFKEEVLESFRDSDYGDLIRNDNWIKHYGYFLYENMQGSCKKFEKRLSLNSKLRRLAHLFLEFKSVMADRKQKVVESCSEMFNIDYYEELKQAIGNMTRDKESNKIKNGLKLTLKYLVKDVCDAMHVYYLKRKENQKAADLGNYMVVLSKSWSSFFKNAEESIITKRLTELRAPVKLPSKSDIVKLRDHTKKTIQDQTGDGYCLLENADFCQLRDALVSRLTLFNARRGGEPSRMVISELEDALSDKWVDKSRIDFVKDDIEKKLLCDTKIAYLHASKIAKLVPVIIPTDCLKALNVLVDVEVRRAVGINPNNNFVFPNTKNSMGHVVGWDCVNRMCQEAGLEKRMNATSMRHYVATEYALLDVAARDRDLFYKHMGHSETINENIYQCPPAVREITHVGRVLGQMDAMNEDEADLPNRDIDSGVNDEEIDAIEEFLGLMAEEVSTFQLLDLSKKVEEKEVTVDVKKLTSKKALLLDKNLQKKAKQYFTSSAWLAVKNTLKMLEEFLGLMAEEVSTFQLLDLSKKVEEKEVTVDVKKLTSKKALLLDKNLQKKAKQYFTSSAWLAVKNTLKMLEAPPRKKTFEEHSSDFHEESLNGSEYLEPSSSPQDSEDENTFEGEEITKEERNALKGSIKKVKRLRHVWSSEEDKAVYSFFQMEIEDSPGTGNEGTLRGDTQWLELRSLEVLDLSK